MCEATITWAPSYKFKKGKYDEKRAPSYCDRVLWDDGSAHGKLALALTLALALALALILPLPLPVPLPLTRQSLPAGIRVLPRSHDLRMPHRPRTPRLAQAGSQAGRQGPRRV